MNEQQLKELLDSLTLDEKIGQMFQGNGDMVGEDGAVTGKFDLKEYSETEIRNMGSILNIYGKKRLGNIQREHMKHNKIPLMFMGDIIYGYKEIFPIAVSQACSFDPDMIERIARITAAEATVDGLNVDFSPMVDVTRDARWGRCAEGYGEDPVLTSRCAAAVVKGYQGDGLDKPDTMVSCVKHFAAYGAAYDGKDYNAVEMSERKLRNEYLKPYQSAVDAGAGMIMTSFNTINGVPTSVNKWLMQDILRDEWGFDGVVISDYSSIRGCLMDGAANDELELAKMTVENETDIDMMDNIYNHNLKQLVESGEISEELIDRCVMRILRMKNDLGLLDDPYKYLDESLPDNNDYAANYEFAKQTVCKSSVLLKNDGVLPLDKSKKVALIGPFAKSVDILPEWSKASPKRQMPDTLENRIKAIAGESLVAAEEGCTAYSDYEMPKDMADHSMLGKEQEYFERAVNAAKNADVVIMALGEHMNQYGESRSRANPVIPEVQMELFRAVKAVNPNVVSVIICGRPLVISEVNDNSNAVLYAWAPGSAGTESIAEMLYGVTQPSGKLSMSLPRSIGQIPINYAYLPTNHPLVYSDKIAVSYQTRYTDSPVSPLYEFGYGLSYTKFEYKNLTLSSDKLDENGKITVSVDVENVGERDGEEVVQMYIRDRFTRCVSRPVKELKDFKRIAVKRGETVNVTFEITEPMLRFFTIDNEYTSEKGEFHLYVGSSSADESLGLHKFYLV